MGGPPVSLWCANAVHSTSIPGLGSCHRRVLRPRLQRRARRPGSAAVTGRWDQPRHPCWTSRGRCPPMDIRSAGHLGVVRYVSDRRPGAEFMKAAVDRTGIGGHASHRTGRRPLLPVRGRERPPIGSVVSTRASNMPSAVWNCTTSPAAPLTLRSTRRSTTNPPPTSSPARSRPTSRAGSR